MRPILRTSLAALALFMLPLQDASAASVFVRQSTFQTIDPLLATFTDASHTLSASLTAGRFASRASAVGLSLAFDADSGTFETLTVTNGNAFPFTIYRNTLRAHLEGTYSIVPPAIGTTTGADLTSFFRVATSGPTGTIYSAEIDQQLRTNGQPQFDSNLVTPTTQGGASVTIGEASFARTAVDFGMPTFTLAPGQSAEISARVLVRALRNSVADFSTAPGALVLSWDLPSGVTLTTDATGPLNWVTAPEPTTSGALSTGLLLIASHARRTIRARRSGR